ncbi:hypothetical protein SKAU_G00273830 [Synaphobranchus kaupii]|uniref:Nuclease HARBI1 n=1 Tax=Synaphobranchus kaupii TaxID=118154 RepID=A0A9Q1IQV2_SYNKA|nr:hypothetical protein SKAU_G00273830 [Synaphobranchus kaupii]
MKTRWMSTFFKALEVHHTFAPDVIAVCAILHNVCLTTGDVLEPEGDDCDLVVVPPSHPVRDQPHRGQTGSTADSSRTASSLKNSNTLDSDVAFLLGAGDPEEDGPGGESEPEVQGAEMGMVQGVGADGSRVGEDEQGAVLVGTSPEATAAGNGSFGRP